MGGGELLRRALHAASTPIGNPQEAAEWALEVGVDVQALAVDYGTAMHNAKAMATINEKADKGAGVEAAAMAAASLVRFTEQLFSVIGAGADIIVSPFHALVRLVRDASCVAHACRQATVTSTATPTAVHVCPNQGFVDNSMGEALPKEANRANVAHQRSCQDVLVLVWQRGGLKLNAAGAQAADAALRASSTILAPFRLGLRASTARTCDLGREAVAYFNT